MKYEDISNSSSLLVIGGVNVLESRDLAFEVCEVFSSTAKTLGLRYVFKGSFDKANRSSISSYRGPGLEKGLQILSDVKEKFSVPVITDVHEPFQASIAAEVADILQLPAFLARQTDLVTALAQTQKIINIKKPQYLSPHQIQNIVQKFQQSGNNDLLVCDRGTMFGYDNLVVDILGFGVMKAVTQDKPVIFDVTHSLQTRDPNDKASGGRRAQFMELARAGVAAGIAGIFIESHPSPELAKCDGPSALPLSVVPSALTQLAQVDALVKSFENIPVQ